MREFPAPAFLGKLSVDFAHSLAPLFYRVGAYFVLTMLDDPAMLALAFC